MKSGIATVVASVKRFETCARAPYSGFDFRSAVLRLSGAASGATLDETSLLDGEFPEGIYWASLERDDRPNFTRGNPVVLDAARAESTGQEPK
jgi:hypothetical protein